MKELEIRDITQRIVAEVEAKQNEPRARMFLAQARVQGFDNAEVEHCLLDGEMVEER